MAPFDTGTNLEVQMLGAAELQKLPGPYNVLSEVDQMLIRYF